MSEKVYITEDTSPEEAIRIAIEREKMAYEFYMKAAKIVKFPGGKEMFEFLAKEELHHRELLEKEYDKHIRKEY